jgi:glycerophosphoryl diester phosphodiesterase
MSDLSRPYRVAHRGGAGLAPENTLAAFRLGLAHDADAVELDLHLSLDGALIVMHDADVRRTTARAGEISALTLGELRLLNAAATYKGHNPGCQRIPTLDEVLELIRGRARVQIEIKLRADRRRYPGIEAKVLETIKRYDMIAEAMVISFNFPTLHTITEFEPQMQTCALISSAYLSRFARPRGAALAAAHLAAQGFHCVGVNQSWMTPRLLQALRARHFRVGVWTVNDPLAIRKFADMGVNFITSDRPDLLRRFIP